MSLGVTLIGAGTMPIAPPVLGGLAQYFGERPLDIRLYDPSPDFLDISSRIASSLFLMSKSTHAITAYESLETALEYADLALFMVPDFRAASFSRQLECESATGASVLKCLTPQLANIPVLNLTAVETPDELNVHSLLDWPIPCGDHGDIKFAFQVLRWANEEEYPYQFLEPQDSTPLHRWLDSLHFLKSQD